jgi:phosphoenolpyruvate carboxylase
MRAIPATMATQHPDNAQAPYWDKAGKPFIGAYQEMAEAVRCFQDLGVDEYMWDWEGKHADAAIIDRLFSEYLDYFKDQQLGRDKFLTLRIPNIWEEKGYNLLQAMTVILSSEDFARDLGFDKRPLFEIILPMTERPSQLMHMQELFQKTARFKSEEFTIDNELNTDYIEMIPLVESVESQQNANKLLEKYTVLHEKHYGKKPEYIRPFLACSDSSLSSGYLAALLGNKIALARLYEFSDKTGIPVYPIAGSGSLHFRGGLSPDKIDRFVEEFPGIRTVSIQSAFRYDNPLVEVNKGIKKLAKVLPEAQPLVIKPGDQETLVNISKKSAGYYKKAISDLAADMQQYFKAVPKRRDRRQHIGLLAYSRSMGEVTLPRAITFTAAFYSIGVPPEIIGLGRALKSLNVEELVTLKQYYPNLTKDAESFGRYFNSDNLAKLAKSNKAWNDIQKDVNGIEEVLGITLGPKTDEQKHHCHLSSHMLMKHEDQDELSKLIYETGVLRRSLG